LLPSLQLLHKVQEEECPPIENWINTLLKLEEVRTRAKQKSDQHQKIVKSWFNTSSSSKINFNIGDLVLKWDKADENKGEHTKFQNLWLGPFVISEKLGSSYFRLHNLEEQPDTFREWTIHEKVLHLRKLDPRPCKYFNLHFVFGSFHFV